MTEPEEIVRAHAAARARGEPCVLATLVNVRGSAYRSPGARMLIGEERALAGAISGGCLERDLVQKARWRTEGGPALVTYDSTADSDASWELGLGCNGIVDVLLEPLHDAAHLRWIAESHQRRQPCALVTAFDGRRLLLDGAGAFVHAHSSLELAPFIAAARACLLDRKKRVLELDGVAALIEPLLPAQRVVLFGAGDDLVPVIELARSQRWQVLVAADRGPQSARARFAKADRVVVAPGDAPVAQLELEPDDVAILMTHSLPLDAQLVPALLARGLRYIGVLGPASRMRRLAEQLALDEAGRARVHGPVGLDLGGDGPASVALSIVAGVQAHLAGRDGRALAGLDRPLREPVSRVESRGERAPALCALSGRD